MPIKIHTYPNNPRAYKTEIALVYNGVDYEEVHYDLKKGEHKTAAFQALSPIGKVPVLETDEGTVFESNAMARYAARLADNGLYGKNKIEAGQVDQWLDWVRSDIETPGAVWLYPIFGLIPNNAKATNLAKEDIKAALSLLNTHLKTRSFIVGERLTLADIVVAMTLLTFYKMVFDNAFRKPFNNVNRWFDTCVNQPNFKKVIGDVTLCKTAQKAPETAAAPAAAKAEPKKEAKKAEPKKENKKKGNPLDSLPPSSLDLNDLKQKYSNESDTRAVTKWFWENLDKEGYSCWFSHYRYPEDNTVLFKTCNLVTGFCQRMETRKLHKYGMGSICLFGEGEIQIVGAYVFRGTEMPPMLPEVPDYPSHEFKKLDYNDEKQIQLFNDIWCWSGDFPGIEGKFLDNGKVFK